MKLTREESKRFEELLRQEADGKQLQVEAEMKEAAEAQKLSGRLMELEAYWLQGQMIRQATITFCKDNGKPCAVAHVAEMFGLTRRQAQARAKFHEDFAQQDLVVVQKANAVWITILAGKKQAKRRQEKAEIKAIVQDEAETIAILADDILSSGKARQLSAIAATAERGEEAEAAMAQAKVEKAAQEHKVSPEVFVAAAKKAGAVEEGDKQKASERDERRKLRSVLAAKYDALDKAEFIDFVVSNIKELGDL